MVHRIRSRNRYRTLLLTCILLLGLLPTGIATADSHRTSTRTPISFSSTPVEILEPGEEWVDAAGIVHVRGEVTREVVEGDINGEAIITTDADMVQTEAGGFYSAWGTVVITDENGSWHGKHLIAVEFEEGDEPFLFGKVTFVGRGDNTGKSIVADIVISFDDESDTANIEGVMLTMAVPSFGINMHIQGCFDLDGNEYGAFLSYGAIESSGGASATFFSGGGPWTHTYGLFGEITISDDNGSLTLEFVGTAQDNWLTSVGWGHWVIVDGTGDYENYNGHGKISGNAGEFQQCEAGFGIWLQASGQVHGN